MLSQNEAEKMLEEIQEIRKTLIDACEEATGPQSNLAIVFAMASVLGPLIAQHEPHYEGVLKPAVFKIIEVEYEGFKKFQKKKAH